MVMGNNDNENSFLSELTVNENQSSISEQLREDDTRLCEEIASNLLATFMKPAETPCKTNYIVRNHIKNTCSRYIMKKPLDYYHQSGLLVPFNNILTICVDISLIA